MCPMLIDNHQPRFHGSEDILACTGNVPKNSVSGTSCNATLNIHFAT